MVVGTVLQGRRYNLGEYVAAGLLILGISLFTLGAPPLHRFRLPPCAPARAVTAPWHTAHLLPPDAIIFLDSRNRRPQGTWR